MLSIYPYVYKTLPYKPLEDVQPVSLACYFNHAFGVGPAVPDSVKTIKDFLALCQTVDAKVERTVALNAYGKRMGLNLPLVWHNLIGEQAVFLLTRKA